MTTNGERVHALYEAFSRGDVPAVLGAFDPQIRWQEAENFRYADRNPYIGPQAVAARFRDGRVIGFQQYTDTKQWADAFGS